jgi:hypothetical protein
VRPTGRELLLAGGAVCAALLLAEGVARVLLDPPRYHRGPAEFHPVLGFRGIPDLRYPVPTRHGGHAVELSGDGFRGRQIPAAPAPSGVTRVALVGDSFLVGEAVPQEQLVTSLLEASLAARGVEAEVYNLSAIDYGTGQELLLLEGFAPRLRPDVVVLAFYAGNDVANNSLALSGRTRVSPGDPIRPYVEPRADGLHVAYRDPWRAFLRRHSRLFATLERRFLGLGTGRAFMGSDPERRTARPAERLEKGGAPREHLEVFRRHEPGHRWEQAWAETFALLRAFRDRCQALGARMLVLVIPSIHQVQQTPLSVRYEVEARAHAGRPLRTLLDWNLPEQRLLRFFRREDIEARLLLGPLREAARAGSRPYARDLHFGRRGHELAADVVRAWLLREAGDTGPEPPSGTAVSWRTDARATLLDFRAADHLERLGDGWMAWIPHRTDGAWGWRIGRSALVALRPTGGDLVVRGWVPEAAPLPLELSIEIIGSSLHTRRVERHGPFEIRIERPRIAARSDDGYVAVVLAPDARQRWRGLPIGLLVQAIGFGPAQQGAPASGQGAVHHPSAEQDHGFRHGAMANRSRSSPLDTAPNRALLELHEGGLFGGAWSSYLLPR